MFKNLIVYRLVPEWEPDVAAAEAALDAARFTPCGATQPVSAGWVEPRGVAHAPLIELIGGQWLLKLQTESRLLPGSVVKRRIDEIAAQIEQQTGRQPGKREKRELKEQATQELLPQAFTKRAASMVWLNPETGVLAVDAGSQGRADVVVTHLIQAMPDLAMRLIQTAESPSAVMTAWLLDDTPAAGFTIDRDAELRSGDEQRSVVRYARHALDTDEVKMHIQSGKQVTRMAMTWRPGPLAGSPPALLAVPRPPGGWPPGISSLWHWRQAEGGEAGLLMVMRPQEWSAAGTAAWAQRQEDGWAEAWGRTFTDARTLARCGAGADAGADARADWAIGPESLAPTTPRGEGSTKAPALALTDTASLAKATPHPPTEAEVRPHARQAARWGLQ